MSKNLFGQEYECDWVTTEGQIYDLAEETHLKDLSDIYEKDKRFDFVAGLDIGYRDETAFVVLATDSEKFYAIDEYISILIYNVHRWFYHTFIEHSVILLRESIITSVCY